MKTRRIGCLVLILIPIVFYGIFWIKHSFIPSWHIRQAKKITKSYSSVYHGDDEEKLKGIYNYEEIVKDKPPDFLCDTKLLNEFIQKTCIVHSSDPLPKKTQNSIWIYIYDKRFGKNTSLVVDTGQYASNERDSAIAYSDELLFVVWRKEDKSIKSYSIELKIIDRASKKETFEGTIYKKDFSINNIAAGFDSKTEKLFLAWNDWSYSNSESLFLGALSLRELQNGTVDFKNAQIHKDDEWEKRNPYFLVDDNNLYLAHSTGDTWGFFAHTGKLSIGVSLIGYESRPIKYKMIASEFALRRIVKIENNIVFYIQMDSKGSGISQIREIPFNKAYQPFN
nr:hypothetical protein [uncultured Desulfobacter sp.]